MNKREKIIIYVDGSLRIVEQCTVGELLRLAEAIRQIAEGVVLSPTRPEEKKESEGE